MFTEYALIDWWWLARQIPWIAGLSLLLGGFSWAHWRARMSRSSLRRMLGQTVYQGIFSLGLALFTLGLALNPTHWWEPYLWGLFSLYFTLEAGRTIRRFRAPCVRRPS